MTFFPQHSDAATVLSGLSRAALTLVFTFAGATIPSATVSAGSVETMSRADLAAHVRFLAQPRLEGRKTGTTGSRLARQYIERSFKASGLVPWPGEKTYSQSFGYGRNIVGILPGSDASLADEIVLLSAHYDHEGKKRWETYPGASDNASGVATLLEAAKAVSSQRPKRSVAFAAFDAEERMMLGSFAFSCRKDVAAAKIVAVVNVDMLGRDFLDVVSNAVFVSGSEIYPELREQIRQSGTEAGIRILPIGTDLVGPRSDHVAFENRGVPCLFFSCGTFRDYHQPTDTPEKLNYDTLQRSANVILETVQRLADVENPYLATSNHFDAEELRTVRTVFSEARRYPDQAGISKEDIQEFEKLEARAQELLNSGRYDRLAREQLALEASGVLAPYVLGLGNLGNIPDEQRREMAMVVQLLQSVYFNHRTEVLEGCRGLVAHVLEHKPGLFRGMPKFEYEVGGIPEQNIWMTNRGDGRYALNAWSLPVTLTAQIKTKWLVPSFGLNIGWILGSVDCEGTREEIADFCLLRLRSQRTNALHFEQTRNVFKRVEETAATGNYQELLSLRLARGGFKDEGEWLLHCVESGNPDLVLEGLAAAGDYPERGVFKAACRLATDHNCRSDVRSEALRLISKIRTRDTLLVLCDVLGDTNRANTLEYVHCFRDDYAFADWPSVKASRSLVRTRWWQPSVAETTFDEVAGMQLRKLTKQDFGKDAERWRNWVKTSFKEPSRSGG